RLLCLPIAPGPLLADAICESDRTCLVASPGGRPSDLEVLENRLDGLMGRSDEVLVDDRQRANGTEIEEPLPGRLSPDDLLNEVVDRLEDVLTGGVLPTRRIVVAKAMP